MVDRNALYNMVDPVAHEYHTPHQLCYPSVWETPSYGPGIPGTEQKLYWYLFFSSPFSYFRRYFLPSL